MAEPLSSKSNTSPTQNGSTTATRTAPKKNNTPKPTHSRSNNIPPSQNHSSGPRPAGPRAKRLTRNWISWTSWTTRGWRKCGCS